MARPSQTNTSTSTLKEPGPSENLLIVEGKSDFLVLKGLVNAHKIVGRFRVYEEAGFEPLRDALDTRLDESGLTRFGIVVDADTDLMAQWNSLRDVLTGPLCRYDSTLFPTKPDPLGTIITQPDRPKLGLWIMPNNQDPGALENFLASLVPAGDVLWDYATACVAGLPPLEWPTSDNWKSKARMYSWLAWQEEPGYPVGLAVRFYLNPHAADAVAFVSWLRRLFDLPAISPPPIS